MIDAITDTEIIANHGLEKLREQIINFRGPEEGRFATKKGANLLEHELHIPNGPPNPILNGNSTSWSLWPTERMKKIWEGIKTKIDKPDEQIQIQDEILADARNGILVLSKNLNISADRIIASASGSDAIIAGKKLLGTVSDSVGTTETGSDVGKGLKTIGKFVEIDLRDIDNNLVSEDVLFEKWKTEIDNNPDGYFVLTLVSKTGTYYPELTTNILNYLQSKNKSAVVDAIQANGRIPKDEVFKYLEHGACKGITITGSKVFEASDHAGFFIASSSGMESIKQNINSKETAQELVEKHGMFGVVFDNLNVNYENNLLELIRVADNTFAIAEGINGDYLYGNKASEYASIYKDVLTKLGFKIIQDEGFKKVTSIISMEKPGIDPLKINELLTELARVGITLGGPMQKLGGRPIFRFGLSLSLAKDKNIDPIILKEKVKELEERFAQAEANVE